MCFDVIWQIMILKINIKSLMSNWFWLCLHENLNAYDEYLKVLYYFSIRYRKTDKQTHIQLLWEIHFTCIFWIRTWRQMCYSVYDLTKFKILLSMSQNHVICWRCNPVSCGLVLKASWSGAEAPWFESWPDRGVLSLEKIMFTTYFQAT